MKIFIHALAIASLIVSPVYSEEIHFEEIKDDGVKKTSENSVVLKDSSKPALGSGLAAVGTKGLYDFTGAFGAAVSCQRGDLTNSSGFMGQIRLLSDRTHKATGFMSCTGSILANYGDRFSNRSCESAVLCQRSLTNDENSKQVNQALNEIVAKDYGRNSLIQNMDEMEKLETLKRFALKKFDQKSNKCYPRYYTDKKIKYNQCDLSLLEEGFEDYQDECKVVDKGCYAVDELESGIKSYKNFKEKKRNPEINFLTDYFTYRAESKVEMSLSNDNEALDRLADLVVSDEFKKASAEKREDMFLKAVSGETKGHYADPVLNYDFNFKANELEKLKKTEKYKEMVALYNDKNLNKEGFIKKFDDFRKKRAKEILGEGKECKQTASLFRLCEEVVSLSKGKTVKKNAIELEHLTSRDLKYEKDMNRLKLILGDKFQEKDFNMIVNSKRCTLHEVYNDQQSFNNVVYNGESGSIRERHRERDEEDVERSPSSEGAIQDRRDMASFLGGSTGTKETSGSKPGDEHQEVTTPASSGFQDNSVTAPPVQPNSFANNYNNLYNPGNFDTFSDRTIKETPHDQVAKDETPVSAPGKGTEMLNDRISDLMKKLEAAEERAAKLKADADAAEADRVKQKKLDEENALIKELKGQIADLKTQSKKEASRVASSPVVESVRAPAISGYSAQTPSIVRGSDSSTVKSSAPVESYDQSRAVAAATGTSSSSASRAPAAATALLTASASSAASLLPPGTVVTNVDGLSVDKARETIFSRIMELNGASFYIEEEGVIKEVKPKMRDGKILLDKDGKPMYDMLFYSGKKEKLAKKKAEQDRAPASITTMADERARQERLKREALYKDLIQFSGGVIEKKKD